MRRTFFILLTMVFVLSFFFLDPLKDAKKKQANKLYKVSAYKQKILKVSDIHNIYYELSGNPKGTAVIILQTDPGLPVPDILKKFFNPRKFKIVIFDQRGTGLSTPPGELAENTTSDIVSDLEKIRKHLGINKAVLFGGFWGSSIAMLYAEKYPENVSGLVLWSIFTGSENDINKIYAGPGEDFFPEEFSSIVDSFDNLHYKSISEFIFNKLVQKNFSVRDRYTAKWIDYWLKITGSDIDFNPLKNMGKADLYRFALLENYFFSNEVFLKDDQIVKNIDVLNNIPCAIINGRYNIIAPPAGAVQLHNKLKNSRLFIVDDSRHWPVTEAMKKAVSAGLEFVLSEAS
ncbi:hypothetical protein DRQ07_02170 [candidate division KSB1 bacterium]|nr:MAG: hypothetical protein DRQ07_02170 [candidate division KSB1 bacterium]